MIRQLRWSPANEELEARIRATLRRQAEEIQPSQPRWDDLVQGSGAVVVSLPGTGPEPSHLRPAKPRRDRAWLRPTLAAAAALAIVLGAATAVQLRGGDDGGGRSTPPADDGEILSKVPTSPLIVSPGSMDFVWEEATPLPTDGSPDAALAARDPGELARWFLTSEWGMETTPDLELRIDPPRTAVPTKPGIEPANGVTVWWSVHATDSRVAGGAVFLRDLADSPQAPVWAVVGAYTNKQDIFLSGVRRDGGTISFTAVDNLPADPVIQVRLDGKVLEELRLDPMDPTKTWHEPDPAPGKVLTLELQHLVEGHPASISAMALPPTKP